MSKGFFKKLAVILLAATITFTEPVSSSIEVQAKGTAAFGTYIKSKGLYFKNMPSQYKNGYKVAKKTYNKGGYSWYGADMNEVTGKYFYMADHTAAWTGTLDILSKENAQKTYKIAKQLTKKARKKNTKYKKAAAAHDALVKHCSYASGQYGGQSAYEALVNKHAVCAGYARAYKLMCDIIGVPCMCVYGNAGGGTGGGGAHQWNIVKLDDGKWYEVDCTFDDPMGGSPNRNFFCLSTARMASGTTPDGMNYYHQRTGLDETTTALNNVVPKATSTKYDSKSGKQLQVK